MNAESANHAFAYLTPNSDRDARLILITNNIYPNGLDYYWIEFLRIAKMNYTFSNIIDLTYIVGHVNPVQHRNLLLCGNAGGFLDDILGFGSMKALVSGVLAAKSIIEKKKHTKFAQKLNEDIDQTTKFRETINTFKKMILILCLRF